MAEQAMPEPWATWATQRGINPSYNAVAVRAGVAVETVRSTMLGTRKRTSEGTLKALSAALGRDLVEVRAAAGVASSSRTPFTLPAEADRLSRRQRDAVLAVVRAMLDPGQEDSDAQAAPMTQRDVGAIAHFAPDGGEVPGPDVRRAHEERLRRVRRGEEPQR